MNGASDYHWEYGDALALVTHEISWHRAYVA